MRKTLACFLTAAMLLTLAFGCAPSQEEDSDGLKLWFPISQAQEKLSSTLGACPYESEDHSIPGLLAALLAGPPPEETDLTAVIPAGTRLLSWSMENRVANVELSAAYAGLVGIDLTLADYCVVLTLTQLPEVEGVRIVANGGGQSYRDRQPLYPEDAMFSGAEEAPVEVTAALYFRRDGGDSLGYELRKFRLTEDKIPAKAVLAALIAGPEDKGLLPLLPPELTVRSAWVDEGTCSADLSGQLLELPEEERALAIESIVETLCSLDTVERVQILIDGAPVAEFGGLDLSGPLPEPTISADSDRNHK